MSFGFTQRFCKKNQVPEEEGLSRVSFSTKMTHMYIRILKPRLVSGIKKKSLLLLGPRQVGKSTLLKGMAPNLTINFASERQFIEHAKDPSLLERSCLALKQASPLILIDEVQRIPTVLNTVQSLIDENANYRFLLSGSSARKLNRGQANLLPGRIIYEKLFPLTYWELQESWSESLLGKCLIKGALPGIIDSEIADEILESYVDIYLREEIQAEALTKDLGDYVRFLDVAAEASGQYFNYSKMSSDTEINKEKIRRFSQILLDTLLIHRIESFDAIETKRKVRQKDRFIFFDNGVRNAILKKNRNTFTPTERGPLFESWIWQQLIAFHNYHRKPWKLSSYRDDQNLEVDLIIETATHLYAIDIKYQNRFRPEFAEPLNEFARICKKKKIKKMVIYLGDRRQQTKDGVEIIGYQDFLSNLASI